MHMLYKYTYVFFKFFSFFYLKKGFTVIVKLNHLLGCSPYANANARMARMVHTNGEGLLFSLASSSSFLFVANLDEPSTIMIYKWSTPILKPKP